MHRDSLQVRKLYEFIRFAIVGVIATAIHYGIYLLLLELIGVSVAYSIGYVTSFIANFYLSSVFTFKERASVKKGIGFLVSHLVNYTLHILFLKLFISVGLSEVLAPIAVFCIVVPINFILVRFVFKSNFFKQ